MNATHGPRIFCRFLACISLLGQTALAEAPGLLANQSPSPTFVRMEGGGDLGAKSLGERFMYVF